MATNGDLADGVYVVGEFLGASPAKEWTDREGNLHSPVAVRILAGQYVESIEFDSQADAAAALGGAEERTKIMVPVRVRGSWEDDRKRFGRVSYLGRRP